MRSVIDRFSTPLKRRFTKFTNWLLLFLSIGSCVFIISVINTKDTYISFIKNSEGENSALVLFLANSVLSMPMYVLMALIIVLAIGKEFYFKTIATRLKINAIGAILLLLLCVLVMQLISYPATL
jgi:hypothetical protein